MGRPRTRSDAEILAATSTVIARVGPARLTLAAVADEVGLSAATVLQRFRSKRGLLLALADTAVEAPAATVAKVRGEGGDHPNLEVLRRVLVLMGTQMGHHAELANHLAFLQLDLSDPDFLERITASMGALTHEVADLLARAVAAGELLHDDPGQLAGALVATWNGALITWAIFRDGALDAWLGERLDTVLDPHRVAVRE